MGFSGNKQTKLWLPNFDKVGKNMKWRRIAYSANRAGKTWSPCRRIKSDSYLSPCTKINLKCNQDLSLKPKIAAWNYKESPSRH